MRRIFYKPTDGWVGDVIPFYDQGEYKLYYLHDEREGGDYGNRTTWNLISTKDFLHFQEHGVSLPNGTEDEPDRNAYTGSVIYGQDGRYHLFYTGHNPNASYCIDGKPLQVVLHAVGDDGIHWTKDASFRLYGDDVTYERFDWRDPFVFWNEDEGEYWMLVTARLTGSSERRGGCIALLASPDLTNWAFRDPFYSPHKYITMECPDYFRMGDWHYLVYSTFSEKFVTHYKKSRRIDGEFVSPVLDTFDGRGFYAAKTASDGNRRYAFGWVPSKSGSSDFGDWEWAGTLVVHEVYPDEQGNLFVRMPEAIDGYFNQDMPLAMQGERNTRITKEGLVLDSKDGLAYGLFESLPQQSLIEVCFRNWKDAKDFGIAVRTDEALNQGYFIKFDPFHKRIGMDMWPRTEPGVFQWQIAGDKPWIIELERPFDFDAHERIEAKILLEDDILCLYVNDQVAMTARVYNRKSGNLGVYVNEGSVEISSVRVRTGLE